MPVPHPSARPISTLAWGLGLAACSLLVGCGGSEPAPAEPASTPAPTDVAGAETTEAVAPEAVEDRPGDFEAAPDMLRATVVAVGLDDAPLGGVAPIVVSQPNAFDEPEAIGPLTNSDGRSAVGFAPTDETRYLRGWDPTHLYFANNYITILPASGNVIEDAKLIMVEAARLAVILGYTDGTPAANENVGVMMVHPTEGPWWPDETTADADGLAVFERVPPGQFVLRLRTPQSTVTDVPSVLLPPGGTVDLGRIALERRN